MIAEGLTASSASKKLEDITFKANGQGSVKEDIGEGRQIAEGDWKGAVREQRLDLQLQQRRCIFSQAQRQSRQGAERVQSL